MRTSGAGYVALFAFIFGVLFVDGLGGDRVVQAVLGAATLGLLCLVLRASPAGERRETWICVAFSTIVEVLCTQLWGLYTYRLGNVPLYVPPGHGLIFVCSLQAARTPFVQTHRRAIVTIAIVVATALGAWGVFAHGEHRDLHGAIYWPFFVAFLLRSKKAPVWALTFAVTAFIEAVGVRYGTWHWSAVVPGLRLPSADPPSLIAGGYCAFAVVATWLGGLRVERVTADVHEKMFME
ncbi:MAG: hypothetical protein JWM74_5439 [Myxococcaceae bacterium]|nr:hypothetical protein [Myxococcaceae bacterium]